MSNQVYSNSQTKYVADPSLALYTPEADIPMVAFGEIFLPLLESPDGICQGLELIDTQSQVRNEFQCTERGIYSVLTSVAWARNAAVDSTRDLWIELTKGAVSSRMGQNMIRMLDPTVSVSFDSLSMSAVLNLNVGDVFGIKCFTSEASTILARITDPVNFSSIYIQRIQ
jgi:hypothetical protein